MKIFLAGATGAVGKALTPLLVERGHFVTGTTRSRTKVAELRTMGAEAVILDVLDGEAVRRAVVGARPDVVVQQTTSLTNMRNLRHFDQDFAETNRLRTEGTANLLRAAIEVGARQFVAQSYAGWPSGRSGSRVKTEDDPLDTNPEPGMRQTSEAIRALEAMVTGAEDLRGTVLRYGSLYGPGTSIAPGGSTVEAVRKRQFPILGTGAGVWSFLHIYDAAHATALAIDGGVGGVFNVVDDEPAEVSVWLPELARALDVAPPRRLPVWLGRLLVGSAVVTLLTEIRGASNARAKRALGWTPQYASWRDGFRRGLVAHPFATLSQSRKTG